MVGEWTGKDKPYFDNVSLIDSDTFHVSCRFPNLMKISKNNKCVGEYSYTSLYSRIGPYRYYGLFSQTLQIYIYITIYWCRNEVPMFAMSLCMGLYPSCSV